MSIQFSWNVTHIKVITSLNTLEDVVFEVTIYPYATDGTNSIFGDELVVELDSPNTADFVSYNTLTNDTVASWVFSKIDKVSIEAQLTEKFNKINNPLVKEKVLPWSM
jgi:hypothetical protein